MFGIARAATLYVGGGGAGSGGGAPPPEMSWNIDTATTGYTNSFYVGLTDGTPNDIRFKSDGTKMWVLGDGNNRIYQYSLSTAWNIATATQDGFYTITQETTPQDFAFSSDGTKLYVIGTINRTVYQYTLSTAWVITSGVTYSNLSFSVNAQDTLTHGLAFKSDGTKMYIIGQTNDTVYQYSLSTAWNISTASYDSVSVSVTAQATQPTSLRFNNDGTKMYIADNGADRIYQYTLSTAWTVSSATYANKVLIVGTYIQEGNLTGFDFNSDLTQVFVIGSALDYVGKLTMSTAEDISTATMSSVDNFRLGGNDNSPQDVTFSPDGTRLYMIGGANNRVYQYALSTAWNVNTMTYNSLNVAVNLQENQPKAIAFNSDGTAMYIVGQTNDTVYQYTLSTAWAVNTATYASKSFAIGTQEATPNGLAFKPDGTKMYVVGDTTDRIYQYALSTAWDISTASYESKNLLLSSQDGVPYSVTFKPDGTKMYIAGAGNDAIYQYNLSTAWDVSTGTYASKSLSIANVDSNITGCAISSDGTKFYAVGTQIRRLVQYTLT